MLGKNEINAVELVFYVAFIPSDVLIMTNYWLLAAKICLRDHLAIVDTQAEVLLWVLLRGPEGRQKRKSLPSAFARSPISRFWHYTPHFCMWTMSMYYDLRRGKSLDKMCAYPDYISPTYNLVLTYSRPIAFY